ncbi:MAG: molybdenum cofactor biosynthesis protein MoaE [Alphaproteobacteria bacterium]|jgi:molybdopterin synthase catalytic subunit|nr:molybdenum cofactor biosynthesis protein MoaE [Alphaproteobacteria bacterium]MCB9984714.1 molybdenum cofactor biosynthesis protein MoaE [Micavibrio sp.]HRK98381.1 molybdenum cofactor biosynthesis protein MoaE [Alphaproteobacteria bacterium]
MTEHILTEISTTVIDPAKAISFVSDPIQGAIDTFIGIVRNHHEGRNVTGITYDVHEGLANKTFQDICSEAQGIWPGTRYFVSHFHGVLDVGGISIVIAVSSPHRADSFEACRFVIEEIKKRAPVWKKEHYVEGASDWLPGHSLNVEAQESLVCCGRCGEKRHAG